MYYVYVADAQLPVAPEKISVKINNANKTITLVNEGEINFLRDPKLTDIEFKALIPTINHTFLRYCGGQASSDILSVLEEQKEKKEPFQFIVVRQLPDGTPLSNTNMTVSLESYTIEEDAKQGFDYVISVKLKQYKDYETKTVKVTESKSGGAIASVTTQRSSANSPAPKQDTTYTVKSGDCLWNIAKSVYGDGSKYTKIYEANKDKITNPNLIYPNQVLTIPSA